MMPTSTYRHLLAACVTAAAAVTFAVPFLKKKSCESGVKESKLSSVSCSASKAMGDSLGVLRIRFLTS